MADEAATPETAPLPTWDVRWLLDRMRKGGEDRQQLVDEAYRRTFQTELGRVVLLDHLQACGVGRIFGADMTDAQLRYSVGLHDSAVMLANAAGYDDAARAATLLTLELTEEPTHEMGTPAHVAAADDDY